MIRRPLIFWVAAVLVTAAFVAWDTWINGNVEPDFGSAFGNWGTLVGIVAVFSVPTSMCHALAAWLLHRWNATPSTARTFTTSALAGVLFPVLLYFSSSLPLEIPVKPLLLPCAIGFLVSLVVLGFDGALSGGIMCELPNQRMKLSWRGGRMKGKGSILLAAAAPRSLCAIR